MIESTANPLGLSNIESLAERRLIGLGEVTHGSGGLHAMAADVALHMIDNFGVNLILFEAPHGVVDVINQAIVQGLEITAEFMSDLYFNWRSAQILSFFNQLSLRNRRLEKKIRLVGIDIRQPAADLGKLKEFISIRINSDCALLRSFPVATASVAAFASFERELSEKRTDLPSTLVARLTRDLLEISKLIKVAGSATQQAEQLQLCCKRLDHWLNTYVHLGQKDGYDRAFSARDEGMANMVLSHLDESGKPILLWAHLAHLVYDNLSLQSSETWLKGSVAGSILRKQLGSSYSVLALMAQTTEISLADGRDGTVTALPESLESNVSADQKQFAIIGPDDLKRFQMLSIGVTDGRDDFAKSTYIPLKMLPGSQFDYAVIAEHAERMIKVD